MDTDAGVREILKIIFGKKPTIPKKIIARSSITSSWLNENFSKRLAKLLGMRQLFISDRWEDSFETISRDLLLSHRNYLSYVMYACLYENICNENIFDSFISVCTLLIIISFETFDKSGVDFSNLNPDIFMVFYQNEMKSCFRKRKEFIQLVDYIRNHKYLKWASDKSDPSSPDDSTPLASSCEKMSKELDSYRAFETLSHHKAIETQVTREILVREVLSTTSAELPDLPIESEVIEKLVACSKKGNAQSERKVEIIKLETSHGDAVLNSDSITAFVEHQENIARHENIIEAVIRYNHSKNSGNEIVSNEIHEKSNRILEQLESRIKSLIEVLDKCNVE